MMHTCPRRVEGPRFGPDYENLDEYTPGHGLNTQITGCSYCGSMDPEDFLHWIRAGWNVGPTDKAYKAYIGPGDNYMAGKFYFQHMNEEQRLEFIRLHNEKIMKIGYPGHFYVLPYFCKK